MAETKGYISKEGTTKSNFFKNAKIYFLITVITVFIIFYLPLLKLYLPNSILTIKIYCEKPTFDSLKSTHQNICDIDKKCFLQLFFHIWRLNQ